MPRLTALKVKSINRPGLHGDGATLFLRVARGGSKQWMQRLTVHGRRHDIGLGSVQLVSLAEAREAAFENRKLARAGGDPLALRQAKAVPTFAELLEATIAVHRDGWKQGSKTESHWRASMRDYALPRLARLPVNAIASADVMAVLTPIWLSKPETAKRVRRRISAVMILTRIVRISRISARENFRLPFTAVSHSSSPRIPTRPYPLLVGSCIRNFQAETTGRSQNPTRRPLSSMRSDPALAWRLPMPVASAIC